MDQIFSSKISCRDHLLVTAKRKHKVSCLTVSLPDDFQSELKKWAKKNIDRKDLFYIDDNRGYEIHPHITIKYGLYTDSADEMREFIEKQDPVEVRLGKISKFRNISDKFDVIKVEVYGPDLQKINKAVGKAFDHDDSNLNYLPHITLAYIKKDSCEDLVSNKHFNGKEFTLKKFVFLDTDSDPHTMYVKASKIDYPRQNLPEHVWDEVDGQHILKPSVEKRFNDIVENILDKNFENYKSFFITTMMGCSITTQFWKEGSDIDIKIVFDKNRFLKQNPRYSGLDEEKLIKVLAEIYDEYKYKYDYKGHPIEFYPAFEGDMHDDEFIKHFDSLYDIGRRRWIKPVPLINPDAYDREHVISEGEDLALEWATKWDLQIGDMKRKVKEFEHVKDHVKTLDKERRLRFKKKMDALLSQIRHDIQKLDSEKKQIKEEYNNSYDEADEDIVRYYGSINAMPEVIRIKMLNMWGYLKIIKLLSEIVDESPSFDKSDIKKIEHVLNRQMAAKDKYHRIIEAMADVEKKVNKKVVVFDFDGTIAGHEHHPEIGEPIKKTIEKMRLLHKDGFAIIISSCRFSKKLNNAKQVKENMKEVKEWLDEHDVPYDELWPDAKPLGLVYVDDRGINVDDVEKINDRFVEKFKIK